MDKQRKFPERRSVLSADDSLCSGMQFFSGLRTVKRCACLFDNQRAEQSVLLVDIRKQVVVEKYRPKLLVCKKPLH